MRSLFAAVPVKALALAKSRLGPQIEDRQTLTLQMLSHVLDVLTASEEVAQVAVISPDDAVLEFASYHNAEPIRQLLGDLNQACQAAADWAHSNQAEALLLIPGDLPYLQAGEIRQAIGLLSGVNSPAVVIGPDRAGSGTNLLITRPPNVIPYRFGERSFLFHQEEARTVGVRAIVFHSAGTAHDVDWPQDLVAPLQ